MDKVTSRESMEVGSARRPTILIVEDDEGMRKALGWLVEPLGVPVKTFSSAEAFLANYDGQIPGCLVIDVRLPGIGGLDLLRELRLRGDEIPVIVLTGYASVRDVVETLKHSATEFLEKPFDNEVLLKTIQRALASGTWRYVEGHEHRVTRERIARLTLREREVLSLVVGGLSSKQIAGRLLLSSKTVEVHRARIMQKMKVRSIAQLVRTALSANHETIGRG